VKKRGDQATRQRLGDHERIANKDKGESTAGGASQKVGMQFIKKGRKDLANLGREKIGKKRMVVGTL